MPLLYELDAARDERPLDIPPREGVDYQTCWTCGKCDRIPKAMYPVKIDLGYCLVERELITDVDERTDCEEWEERC